LRIPYKWIAVGVVVALLVGMLGTVVWTPAQVFYREDVSVDIYATPTAEASQDESRWMGNFLTSFNVVENLPASVYLSSAWYGYTSAPNNGVSGSGTSDMRGVINWVWIKNNIDRSVTALYTVDKYDPVDWGHGSDTLSVGCPFSVVAGDIITGQIEYTGNITEDYLPSAVVTYTNKVLATQSITIPNSLKGELNIATGSAGGVVVTITGPQTLVQTPSNMVAVFSDITPGDYTITLTKAGFTTLTRTATVVAGQTTFITVSASAWTTGVLPTPGTKSIIITVRGTVYITGPLISGASVTCNGVTQTTTAGVTTFTGLAAGTYVITSTKTGFNDASITVIMTPDSISASDVILMTPVSGGGGGGGGGGDGGGGTDNATAGTNWMPAIILGAIGSVVFLICILAYTSRSNPVYLFIGICALIICSVVGLMLAFNVISFDSGAVIQSICSQVIKLS
jgi:hypothetical protein